MRHPTKLPAETVQRFGSILPGEIMPMSELARRFGWGKRLMIDIQRAGLKSVLIGKRKFVCGDWVLEYLKGQAEQRATGKPRE